MGEFNSAQAQTHVRNAGAHGLKEDQITRTQLISPAQAEKLVKKSIIDELAVATSSGTTIALSTDKRPEILPVAAIHEALKKL